MGPEEYTSELYILPADATYDRGAVKMDSIKSIKVAQNSVPITIGDQSYGDITTQTLTFSCSGSFDLGDNQREIIFDLFHPVKCNCRNCGAPVRLNYCEYCGTQYPNDMKLVWEKGK